MKHKLSVAIAVVLLLAVALPAPLVLAQSDTVIMVVDPNADAELEILENEIAQLRRKLRLMRMKDIQKSKEWRENYKETAARITEWNNFADKYGVATQ